MTVYCGVDFHARQQTIAYCDTQEGEIKITRFPLPGKSPPRGGDGKVFSFFS
jgi:hypothetical protein